jgi:hypothetical protein
MRLSGENRQCEILSATTHDERSGHKKTVSESETVAGQQSEKTTEMPKAKSEKPVEAKTLRPTRGSLLNRIPRFVNRFFG